MKVSDASDCVAYYYKRKRHCIVGPYINEDPEYDYMKVKRYVLHLTDKARKTATQQRIRKEIESSTSFTGMLHIVDRVIRNGDATEYTNYYA